MAQNFFELEERLKDLSTRRKILEQKSQLREATLAEFRCIKVESIVRLRNSLEKNNSAARERNSNILRELDITLASMPSQSKFGTSTSRPLSSAEKRLKMAREQYQAAVENMLPAWHSEQSSRYQLQIDRIQAEKRTAEERRRRMYCFCAVSSC